MSPRSIRAFAIRALLPMALGACAERADDTLLRRGGLANDREEEPSGSTTARAGGQGMPGIAAPGDEGATDKGGDEAEGKAVLVRSGKTDNAELVETLPVGTNAKDAPRRVVMRLDPKDLPDLAAGDRLIAPAEVQATTRCDIGQNAPGCGYAPNVAAQLVLSGSPDGDDPEGAGTAALSEPMTKTCTSAEHHCMFVFLPEATSRAIEGKLALPCVAARTCNVNLVMWAWHPSARANGQDKVLVGGNDGDYLANGKVEGDIGRLMAIRERGIVAADREVRESKDTGSVNVPTNASATLLYSHPLKVGDAPLVKGEQFAIEAKAVASVGGRARFSTEMFVTRNPKATDANGDLGITPKAIAEQNGTNCLAGKACATQRVAVFEVDADVAGQLYVNVVAKSAVPGGGSTSVTVKRADGFVRSTRYAAEHRR